MDSCHISQIEQYHLLPLYLIHSLSQTLSKSGSHNSHSKHRRWFKDKNFDMVSNSDSHNSHSIHRLCFKDKIFHMVSNSGSHKNHSIHRLWFKDKIFIWSPKVAAITATGLGLKRNFFRTVSKGSDQNNHSIYRLKNKQYFLKHGT